MRMSMKNEYSSEAKTEPAVDWDILTLTYELRLACVRLGLLWLFSDWQSEKTGVSIHRLCGNVKIRFEKKGACRGAHPICGIFCVKIMIV